MTNRPERNPLSDRYWLCIGIVLGTISFASGVLSLTMAQEPTAEATRYTQNTSSELQQKAIPTLITQTSIEYRPAINEDLVPPRFRLPASTFKCEIRPLDTTSTKSAMSFVTFPSPMETPHHLNNTVHCEYYRPQASGECPGVIVLHILGGSFELSRICCRVLANEGVGALFVKMPYYGPRRDPNSNIRMISKDPYQTVFGMTQAVLDVRWAAAWLASQEEINADQLGITGISLGGIVSALTFSAEPRFQKGCFILAGGNLAKTFWELDKFNGFQKQWIASGKTVEDFQKIFAEVDPTVHARYLEDRQVLMFNAKNDVVIPPSSTTSLWKAFGKPQIIWWDTGHYSAIKKLPAGLEQMSSFFSAE